MSDTLEEPEISLSVFAYNSKVYYVITQGTQHGDMVYRLAHSGNETVLDALSQVTGLDRLNDKQVWIARPQPGGAAHDTVLQVDWREITAGAATATNYQVLPGDRIFVAETPFIERSPQHISRRSTKIAPIGKGQRILTIRRLAATLAYAFFFRAASTGSLLSGSLVALPVSAAL